MQLDAIPHVSIRSGGGKQETYKNLAGGQYPLFVNSIGEGNPSLSQQIRKLVNRRRVKQAHKDVSESDE